MGALGRLRYFATIDATMAWSAETKSGTCKDLKSSLAAIDIDEVLLERPGNSGNSGNFLAARERRKNYFLARSHHLRALSGGAQVVLVAGAACLEEISVFPSRTDQKVPRVAN